MSKRITPERYRRLNWQDRNGGEEIGFPELTALNALVDAFAQEMKRKLRLKWEEGYGGWADDDAYQILQQKLDTHVERGRGQRVDAANLLAMLWNLEERS